MTYQGDLLEDQILYFEFTSRREDTGVPIVLAGTPSLAVYKDDSTTQSTAGITLTVSHDGVVGKNNVKIDTSADAFYATGADYSVVIAAGTVNSNSVVGEVVGSFSIENRSLTQVDTNVSTAITDIGTAQADLDIITDTDGVILGAAGVDLIWDEVLTGGTHNVASSAGRRLRQLEAAFIVTNGTAQAGASNTITLAAGESATDDIYNHDQIIITEGTGAGESALIVDYNGTTKVAKIAPPWVTTPDATSVYEIVPALAHAETGWATIKVGIAAAATSTTITLDSDASAVDDYYNEQRVHIDAGTGEGQSRVITDYVGSTKVATVSHAWTTTPDTTSEYIIEEGAASVDYLASEALTQITNATVNNMRKNTALANFMFTMTDDTNHAPATGLTVTATRSLDGAAFASCANSVTEVSSGWYKINLDATDTNGDTVALRFTATSADDTNIAVVTQP